jgi:selenocysteine-specific elongation factor
MKQQPPGLLPQTVDPDVIMMICTAGHVDHGKTQLVKLLTGCRTDRLKVEQERGLTIELGFAPCFLGGKLCVGIVDVPGHEKFVKNMVAGVSGIAMTVLVVAADDGVMPQTVEHLQIMELLGVRQGMIALTKIDLVSPERVEEAAEEIRVFLEGTFLDGAPICPVSSETFVGYGEFYQTLVKQIEGLARAPHSGVFRMPIERAFTQEGFGAVATGIPVDGSIEVGDAVEIVPGGRRGKIRGIQRFLRDARSGGHGQCLALNISGLGREPLLRGQVVSVPGYLEPARFFHALVHAVPGLDPPLRNAESIKFHAGTVEESGKVYLLEDKTLGRGGVGLATVALPEAVAAAVGDRFILRRPSPAVTVAGGEILGVDHGDRRPRRSHVLADLEKRRDFFHGVETGSDEGVERRVEFFLRWEKPAGASRNDISKGALLLPTAVKESISRLGERGTVIELADDCFVHGEAYEACLAEVESRVVEATESGHALSLRLVELRKDLDWPAALWRRIEADLEKKNLIQRRDSKLILQSAVDKMSDADRRLADEILGLYDATGFHSPRPDELSGRISAPPERIDRLFEHLCNEGRLIRLEKKVVLHVNHFKRAQDLVVRTIQEEGTLNSGVFKTRIDSTRKYALAILDFLDQRHVTVRVESDRKLVPGYEKNLL